ncbi:hypothetical protein BGZ63DRAFT_416920 [Mariannaea sp. PMI_226]|nr:hypothetical protein BGZ63DRAFT_416920 [Mariannaea sp. PMI_226]
MATTHDLPKIKLHWYRRHIPSIPLLATLDRSRSQRILWLLEELKLPYELEIYHRDKQTQLAPPELEKVHPLGKSPVVTVEASGSDGAPPLVLAESGFITEYLVGHSPEGKRLMPEKWRDGMEGKFGGETEAWMRYQYYMHFAEGSFMPTLVLALFIGGLRSPSVPFFIRPITSLVANRIFANFIFPNTRRSLALLETHLSDHQPGGYLCGDHLTAVDILMSFPLIAAKDKMDSFGAFVGGSWKTEFPKLAEYVTRIEAEEGYKKSVEKIKEIEGDFQYNKYDEFFLYQIHTDICSRCASQLRSIAVPRLGAVARYATLSDSPQAPPVHNHETPEVQRTTGVKRPGPAMESKGLQDPALALFNDVVSPTANISTGTEISTQPVMSELELVAKVNHLVQRGMHLHKEYHAFREEIWPHIVEMPQIPKTVYEAATEVLGKVRSQICWVDGNRPVCLEIAQMYDFLGRRNLDTRNDIVLTLCHNLVETQHPSWRRQLLMKDLVGLWQHISQLRRRSETDQGLRFALPTAQDVLDDLAKIPKLDEESTDPATVKRALSSIFLLFPPAHAESILPGLLATLALLSDKKFANRNFQIQAAPLLHLVQLIVLRLKGGLTPERNSGLRTYVLTQLPEITKLLLYQSDHWQGGLDTKVESDVAKAISLSTFHAQLRAAYRSRNTGAILSIWQNLKSNIQSNPRLDEDIRDDPHFLDFWIFVWCGVRRSNMLQETLDLMNRLGIEPTLKTYTAMMHGWKMAKETAKIEALWAQLTESGMKLDVIVWTERVSALIEGGQPEMGVQALVQMVTYWKKAVEQGRQNHAVEPTIAVVNAVLKGLLRQGDANKANEVLGWAGKEGFSPDVRTFNILLRETLRGENSDNAKSLLHSMRQQGIEPDSATFTILLEGVLGRMGSDVAVEEQLEAIDEVFTEFEYSGVKPGLETYGKMLYAVASLSNGSEEAIAAVQEHMRRGGFTITAHMVTILIERALKRNPPDIAKVRALLQEHKLDSIEQGDQTLWERVVSAFAVAGQKEEAMALFDKLTDAGRPVTSLPCLTDLLRMLLEVGDRPTGARVVKLVLENRLKRGEQFNERYWRHHFWHLAKGNGLLQGVDVPNELRDDM